MKLTVLAATIVVGSPALAGPTCADYEMMIREEGVRTLQVIDCVSESEASALPEHWNAVLETPAFACFVSRLMTGEPDVLAFMAYVTEMNAQREARSCPPPAIPLAQQP